MNKKYVQYEEKKAFTDYHILLKLFTTQSLFNYPWLEAFWKHCGKKEKMLETSIFSFSHNLFYPSLQNFNFWVTFILSSANAFNLD